MKFKTPPGKIDALALGMAQGATLAASARAAKIPERTARDIAKTEAFRATTAALRAQIISATVGTLVRFSASAVITLGKLLAESNPPEIRLRAAVALLDKVIVMQVSADMADRLSALEAAHVTN